jgi:hypothetical protein
VGIIFDFLVMEGSPDKVQPLLARLDGAEALLRLIASDNAGGFGTSDLMSADMRVMAAGRNMGQIQGVSREVLACVREQVDAETVDKTVVAIPGLWQFI